MILANTPGDHDVSRLDRRQPATAKQSSAYGGAPQDPAKAKPADLLPSVTLPQGGGAMRGIGEKFSVSAVTGTAGLTLPLALSPGRSGFTPGLELQYDSGSGNGPFGFGWTLSLPSITRKTDKGLPQYRDSDESDVFILSGAEDLVPILDANGARVHEPKDVGGIDYDIHLYRPRIEGLFSRIERWVNLSSGLSHWRTISGSNVTTLYGYDNFSSVSDPTDAAKIFSWHICRSWDDKGNIAIYSFVADDDKGVDASSTHEANRTSAVRATQRYLSLVCYGNTQPYLPVWSERSPEIALPTHWLFKIAFDYGDHAQDVPIPAPTMGWPTRPDPFSNFRATFEVRTYRRVQRVLYFHNFPQEKEVGSDCLVRSTDFVYSDQQMPADPRNPIYTFLVSATQTGYRRDGAAYASRSMPPLAFAYSQPQIQTEVVTADRDSLANLPEGIDGTRFEWVDLDGEGVSGILADWGSGWGYKPNLSPANRVPQRAGSVRTSARFGPLESVAQLPSRSGLAGQHLLDLSGDGRLDIVDFARPDPGFFERTADEDWQPFHQFDAWPDTNWSEPNLKFVDLTGDGLADMLITEDGVYTLYPSLGEIGYGEARLVRTPWDEDRGPKVVMADGTETMFLADMTGDGLSDIVRVRNGEVSYWPNLGYGRFGTRVSMDHAPRFIDEERFDPQRLRLADVDGSGTADLVYVGGDGVQVCFNQSGNAWSQPNEIAMFPTADKLSNVQVIDLLGTGTACLIWSSPLAGVAGAALRYIDLMGGNKPHLLTLVRNNLGAETRITYSPSTQFYIADKIAGRPWITRLPFPVQVVERVETFDWIGRNRFVTRYEYHHGYFDGYEREFRGFGRVDQWDTEEFRNDTAFPEGELLNWKAQSWTPPTLTRTWFHTGAFEQATAVSQQYASEYWVEPSLRSVPRPMLLPDTGIPSGVNPFEMREAYRSLKGQMLRSEIYATDRSPSAQNPYSVTEQNFTIEFLQPMGVNLHAVFFSHSRETVSFHYERNPTDPRVIHDLTLEVDSFGNLLRSVSIGYPRRLGYAPPEPALSAGTQGMLAYDQGRLHILSTRNQFTNVVNGSDAFRKPLPQATIAAELTGITPAANAPGLTNLFGFEELDAAWQTLWDGTHDIPYEAIPPSDVDGAGIPAAAPTRRIVQQSMTLYRSDDLTALLAPGVLQSLALPGDSYRQALTPGLLANIFGPLVPDAALAEGGYVQLAGYSGWWIPSGRQYYSAGDADTPAQELATAQAAFFLPRRAIDPFAAITRAGYDAYNLLPATATDAVGNVTSAVNDYRVLQPEQVTDPNGNRALVAFDLLGMVVGTAVMGKVTENLGDSLTGFVADLDDATIQGHMTDPLTAPGAILTNATTRIVYDLAAFYRTGVAPPAVYTLARETHVSDLAGQITHYQHKFAYSDGLARVIQSKGQVAPGPLTDGTPLVNPRWVGSGWTIFNNKGNPVRKYEPFFSATNAFEFAAINGVSNVLLYDAAARLVATLHPDSTWEKTVYEGWRQETWDGNDTVLVADPRTDEHIGDYFLRLLGPAPNAFTSWHDLRIGGTLGTTLADQTAQKDAAQKTEAHAATPMVTHFDALGRTCLIVADNGGGMRYPARTALDSQNKTLAVFDALGRRVSENIFRAPQYIAGTDMAGNGLYNIGMDSGARRTLVNVAANPIRKWDARGNAFRNLYDPARRPTHRYVSTSGAAEILLERLIYGEGLAADLNLNSRLFRHYDPAGVAMQEQYDYKGNLLSSARQLAVEYHQSVDWSSLANLTNAAALDAAAAPLLVTADRFEASSAFDALNRAIQVVTPHSATMSPNVLRPSFDEASQLSNMDVWSQHAAAPTTLLDFSTADVHAITAIAYNPRGQRATITLGNQTVTSYEYDEQTFRLTNLATNRPGTFAQNQQSVQALVYSYDPVGNVTRIRDNADTQNVIYFNNERVDPTCDYTCDPLYWLIRATGREHLGQNAGVLLSPQQINNDDSFRMAANLPHPSDGTAMGVYTETYTYDPAGNILSMFHQVSSGAWTRRYTYSEASPIPVAETGNRLSTTSLPGDPAAGPYTAKYSYDAHGNMTKMPHLPALVWDEQDRLRSTTRQVVNNGTPVTTFYTYGADGERVCKVTDNQAAADVKAKAQSKRIYLGAVEIYREFAADGITVTLQRETLHIMDGERRVTMVETLTKGVDRGLAKLIRYQFTNHLESATLELDDQAQIISYEEYFPYGSTSYQAVRKQTDTPKRYRYTGKERDEENDLYYHGARYYAPWLGRWTACDPAGLADGNNLYSYVSSRPTYYVDRKGTNGLTPEPGKVQQVWNYVQEAEKVVIPVVIKEGKVVFDAAKRIGSAFEEAASEILPATATVTLGAVAEAAIPVTAAAGMGYMLANTSIPTDSDSGSSGTPHDMGADQEPISAPGAESNGPKISPGIPDTPQTMPGKSTPVAVSLPADGQKRKVEAPAVPSTDTTTLEVSAKKRRSAHAPHRHHVLPQTLEPEFAQLGIDIHALTKLVPGDVHLNEIHGSGQWNPIWKQFMGELLESKLSSNLLLQVVFDFMYFMERRFGLTKGEYQRYTK